MAQEKHLGKGLVAREGCGGGWDRNEAGGQRRRADKGMGREDRGGVWEDWRWGAWSFCPPPTPYGKHPQGLKISLSFI